MTTYDKIYEEQKDLIVKRCESRERQLMFLVLSGSHAWGTNHAKSDIDLRGVYLESTENILKINRPSDCDVYAEGDCDVQLYELEKWLGSVRKGNVGMINLLFSPWIIKPANSLLEIGKKFLTQSLRFYYRGVIVSHKTKAIEKLSPKELLAAYKEILQGIYLMVYNEVRFNFADLYDNLVRGKYISEPKIMLHDIMKYDLPTLGRFMRLSPSSIGDRIEADFEYLFDLFDTVATASLLPEDFDGLDEVNAMLLRYRRYNVKKFNVMF